MQLNRLIISPEPIFHTLIPRRGPAHGWLLYYYWCCCSSCLAGRHVWLELRLPPRNPFHSFQTGMPIFRVLLSAVMAVESLASFNPSLLPMGWLAEGMPLRSSSPHRHQFLTTLPHLPLSNVEEVPACVCAWQSKEKVEPLEGSFYWELGGHGFRWRTKHKMIMIKCGYFWDPLLVPVC